MMKKVNTRSGNMIYLAIFLFLLLSSTTCNNDKGCPEGSHNQIEIKNNSSKTINWQGFDPDSIYRLNGQAHDNIILHNSNHSFNIRNCWEETFKDSYSAYFLIFDNDTVQAIGWQAISGTNRGLLKRIKVDLSFLKANSFIITYP
jgi:hypothetical protein